MEKREPVLVLEHLAKRYGTIDAVVDANLTLARGEILALVGDNGAGKSTVTKMISGVIQPTSGTILLNGQAQHFRNPLDARKAGIETVYQDLALAPHLNVAQNMFLGRVEVNKNLLGRLFGDLNTRSMTRQAATALEQLHIQVKSLTRPISRLSGGQRQAVAIARSLLWGKEVLLLDEPTNHLGVHEVEMVLNLTRNLSASGVSVIYISHTLPHVFQIADRIAIMRLGTITTVLETAQTTLDEVVSYITGTKVSA